MSCNNWSLSSMGDTLSSTMHVHQLHSPRLKQTYSYMEDTLVMCLYMMLPATTTVASPHLTFIPHQLCALHFSMEQSPPVWSNHPRHLLTCPMHPSHALLMLMQNVHQEVTWSRLWLLFFNIFSCCTPCHLGFNTSSLITFRFTTVHSLDLHVLLCWFHLVWTSMKIFGCWLMHVYKTCRKCAWNVKIK